MKKLLILTTLALGLFTACTNNANKESEAAIEAEKEQMKMTTDSANAAYADSVKAAADKASKDSADAAHGHSH